MPTDSRTRPSGTDDSSPGQRRRRSRVDSTPPRLVAKTHSRQAVDQGVRRRGVGELDGDQRPEAGHRPARPPMRRVVGSPGKRTRWTAGWPASRSASSWAFCCARSRRSGQGAQAAQRQVDLHRPRDGAEGVPDLSERRHRLQVVRPRHHRPEQHVGVPGEHLGHRVHDQAGSVLERPLQQGSGKRVVDHEPNLVAQLLADPGQVGHLHHRVGGRLQPHQVGAVGRGQHRLGVDHVHPADRPAVAEGPGLDRRRHPEVAVARHDHRGAGLDQLEDRLAGRHARGEGQRRAALQRADRLLQRDPGRVAVPAVPDRRVEIEPRRRRSRRTAPVG